ncbi:hypothetical protein [Sediminicoccus sp. KRV36]|uniref:hypothetical protein n=1 Tax=Sediminicoccus sp. KRV36 TaxID=3133721 RepID=UPI00200DE30C|nr:hypothetical protein [Sediminicoccus rosea]UPY37027.1 hypothetical protein LHU95_22890 [Sediminicoccus rosea]
MNAAELATRFALKRNGREFRGACPCCGKPSLTVEDKAGKTFWRCFYGCDQGDLTRALLGGEVMHSPMPASSPNPDEAERRRKAMDLWGKGVELTPAKPSGAHG